MCSASGGLIPPRVIYIGVRDVVLDKRKDLPRDGLDQVSGNFLSVPRAISLKICLLKF